MSDVEGSGYGSDHNWKKDITGKFMINGSPEQGTRWICRDCGEIFVHWYDLWPGIFEAMEYRGIPRDCPATMKGSENKHNSNGETASDTI